MKGNHHVECSKICKEHKTLAKRNTALWASFLTASVFLGLTVTLMVTMLNNTREASAEADLKAEGQIESLRRDLIEQKSEVMESHREEMGKVKDAIEDNKTAVTDLKIEMIEELNKLRIEILRAIKEG